MLSADPRKFSETLVWNLKCLVSCLQRERAWHTDVGSAVCQAGTEAGAGAAFWRIRRGGAFAHPKKCFAVGLREHCKLFRALVNLPHFFILNTVPVPPCLLDIFTHLPSRGSGDQQKPDVLTSSCEERLEAAYYLPLPSMPGVRCG